MISLVAATYKSRQKIATLVEFAGAALASTGEDYELVIVDRDSPDGTARAVQDLQATRPWLKLLAGKNGRGLSTAVIAGWRISRGDVLGSMDADAEYPPELLAVLVERLRSSGADIVVASRHLRGRTASHQSWSRRLVSRTALSISTFVLPRTLEAVCDPMSGFFFLRRHAIDGKALDPIGDNILLEILAKADYTRVEEVPVVLGERAEGGRDLGLLRIWRYGAHLARTWKKTGEAVRMAKFALVGLSGVVVNLFCYRLLVAAPGWTVKAAASGAAGVAVVNNFIWNERYTFWETHKASPDWDHMLRRFMTFALFSGIGLLFNVGVVGFLVGTLRVPWLPGVMAGIGLASAWNFFANSNLTWRAWWHKKALPKPVIGCRAAEAACDALAKGTR